MKTTIVKKAIAWLGAGVLLGIGFIIAIMFALELYTPEFDSKKYISNYITGEEERIGISCKELNNVSHSFVLQTISPLVESGLKGKDWVAMAPNGILEKLEELDNQNLRCSMLKSNAEKEGIVIDGKFEQYQQLFSALSMFIEFSGKPPSANNLKPGAFEKVNRLYQDITNG